MPLNFNWNPIFDNNSLAKLTVAQAQNCIATFNKTAQVHPNRDFKKFAASDLVNKVNTTSNGFNWMKIRSGVETTTGASVYIIYHLLRHRVNDISLKGKWGISVGFDPQLVGAAPKGVGVSVDPPPASPYIDAAIAFVTLIHSDLPNFVPYDGFGVIYDDVAEDKNGNLVGGGFGTEAMRRTTPVGELGWVVQHNQTTTSLFQFTPILMAVPATNPKWGRPGGDPLPGGGIRPKDSQIVTTLLTLKN